MSWWCENRRTLFIGFIVLVELVAVKNCLPSERVAAEPSMPETAMFEVKIRTLREGRTGSFTENTGQIPVLKTVETGKANKIDSLSSSTMKITDDRSQKMSLTNTTIKVVKEKTLIIPDRSPENFTSSQIKEENLNDEEDVSTIRPGQGNFDENAAQRAIIVIAGIAVIVLAYLGIKFALVKQRKVVKRYGRVEASEVDLLDEREDEEDSDEEEELFDINEQRR